MSWSPFRRRAKTRIAIDARKLRDFGIGSYIEALLLGLERHPSPYEFVVFVPPQVPLPTRSERFRPLSVRAANYGVAEHLSLPALALRHGASLYHSPHYVLPWLAPRPAVVTIHDIIHLRFPEYLPHGLARGYARRVMARAVERSARVLTVSEASRRDILETFRVPPERVRVIPNQVDGLFFVEPDPADLARVRERWRLEHPFVLYAGNVKPHKNLERLVRAFAAVAAHPGTRDVRLVLLGNDHARYHVLRRLAAELRLADRVRFLGWVPREELSLLYRLAAAFAFPSLYEGFGLPPLEAMAAGTPVLASSASSLPEVCGDGALLVDPLSTGAIAAGLLRLLLDDGLRKDLAHRGRARAEHYRGIDIGERMLAVYRDILEGP